MTNGNRSFKRSLQKLGWLVFGVAPQEETPPASMREPELFEPSATPNPRPAPPAPDQSVTLPGFSTQKTQVRVSEPVLSPINAFKEVITDGTRQFCEEWVYPVFSVNKGRKFHVTGIKIYVDKSDTQLMAVLEKLPIDIRNELALNMAQLAPGAAEQLIFDDGFFGVSIDVEPAVIAGRPIRLMTTWTGGSTEIQMDFTGKFETKPAAQPVEPVAPVAPSAPANAAAPANTTFGAAATNPVQKNSPTHQPKLRPVAASSETPLGPLRPGPGVGTPLNTPQAPQVRHIANIRILPFGAEKETEVELREDMLPFILGREHEHTGRFKNGHTICDETDPEAAFLLSREHFELHQFDKNDSRFNVINHARNRNGTYQNGCALPDRFMFKAVAPGNVFILGGADGAGTVRVTIEAV
jgi:hypothetical protein